MEDKQSFITEARREQIIKAAIEALQEIGYVNISLAKIARKANISTGLISYHFSGKEDLMNNTLIYLIEQEWLFVSKQVTPKSTWTEKLIAFIEASLTYQVLNRANSIALIEIVFNARTVDQIPYYLLEDDEEDLKTSLLKEILFKGQEVKEFGDFRPEAVSTIIQGAVSEMMLSSQKKLNHEEYSLELIKHVLKIIK